MTEPANSPAERRAQTKHRLETELAVEELVAATAASTQQMHDLVAGVNAEKEARERKVAALERSYEQSRKLAWIGLAAIALMVILGIINAANLNSARKNAKATADIARATAQTNSTLADCLNVRGECGKLSAQSQKRVLDEVKLYSLTVVYCARTNPQPTDPKGDKFITCVNKLYPTGPALDRQNQ